ncbi:MULTISPECIES: hypothetical protein [Marinobacter]|uniref:Uncharacterized protein n=1 Tax=Marinobacter metalliresistant TaxID=2961995 RepID=A0ABZ2W0E2_9GAMM|nr:hypothetical protein [Marinobacter sp. Arc7-DN-1]AXS84442.1 hypothetical protein D0851_16280 [Marinobacter sp. Arc7-DN-1]
MSADLFKINPIQDEFNIFLHFYGVRLKRDQRPRLGTGRQSYAIALPLSDALVKMLRVRREPESVLFLIAKEIK